MEYFEWLRSYLRGPFFEIWLQISKKGPKWPYWLLTIWLKYLAKIIFVFLSVIMSKTSYTLNVRTPINLNQKISNNLEDRRTFFLFQVTLRCILSNADTCVVFHFQLYYCNLLDFSSKYLFVLHSVLRDLLGTFTIIGEIARNRGIWNISQFKIEKVEGGMSDSYKKKFSHGLLKTRVKLFYKNLIPLLAPFQLWIETFLKFLYGGWAILMRPFIWLAHWLEA